MIYIYGIYIYMESLKNIMDLHEQLMEDLYLNDA